MSEQDSGRDGQQPPEAGAPPKAPPRPRTPPPSAAAAAAASTTGATDAAEEAAAFQEELKAFGDDGNETQSGQRKESLTNAVQSFSNLFGKKRSGPVDDADERWLLRIASVDYGPFDGPTVRAKLQADEIDEHTLVTDTNTGEMSELVDLPHFTDFVLEYIPQRERRKIEAQERREELVREVKKRGVRATFSTAIGAVLLAVVGLTVLHFTNLLRFQDVAETLRPSPVEFPFEQVVRDYRFRFVVPEPEYQAIQADSALLASLFQPEQPGSRRRGGSRSSSGGGGGGGGDLGPDSDDYVMDFSAMSGPAFRLTSQQINDTLTSNSGGIQSCFAQEMRSNPSFRGMTIRFSIQPSGQTFNVRVSSDSGTSSTAERCVVNAVRRIRFPQFNDFPMNLSYPFYVN